MQQAVWIYAGRNESVLYWRRSGEALSRSVGGIVEAGRVKSNQGRTGTSGPSPRTTGSLACEGGEECALSPKGKAAMPRL